jgi:nuclear transport factor 2 (NTF2) superfamily protein
MDDWRDQTLTEKEILMTDHTLIPEQRLPLPPFTRDSAIQKVRLAEDGWNSRDPEKVALAYTPDSHWRNRAEFASGRQEIVAFLRRKWAREFDYRADQRALGLRR